MKIYFKNGMSLDINQEIAKIIREKLLEGSVKFQCFSDQNNDVYIIVNVEEIVYIA